jgi:hypothetical protein
MRDGQEHLWSKKMLRNSSALLGFGTTVACRSVNWSKLWE